MASLAGPLHPMYRHGECVGTRTKEWRTWNGMHRRCRYPSMHRYNRYGGRGISVCARWGVYENFLADMGRAPSEDHQLDRIDNDGNYEPSNCRWTTRSEQIRNSTKARKIEFRGKMKTIGDWSSELGINRQTLQMRLDHYGWSIEKALTTPVVGRMEVSHR